VVIRVHVEEDGRPVTEDEDEDDQPPAERPPRRAAARPDEPPTNPEPENDFEHAVVDFTQNVIEKMGYTGKISVSFRRDKKLGLRIDSQNSGILIGRKGKNLDAIQLLANVVAGRLTNDEIRVVIDSEDYRVRREEQLVRMARKIGEQVRRSKGSRLLEPMNPFERRLIHTALNDMDDVDTKSEGEGLYKQVRVYYRGVDR
jgi:spoIIIJ-associated protein